MRSYVSIDRIEGKFAVCEVELCSIEESRPDDYSKDTIMIDVCLQDINYQVKEVNEGDILIVEHDDENITFIYGKDDDEKNRRIEILKRIMKK